MNPGRELDAIVIGKHSGKVRVSCLSCNKTFDAWLSGIRRGQNKYCSHECSERSKRKHPIQEFNGIRYYRSIQGYMVNPDLGLKMHREVWSHFNGPIPDGYLIHHVNQDRADNRIENLALVKWSEHTSEHSKDRWVSGAKIGKTKKHFVCDSDGCERPSKARGLCTMHYQRQRAAERGRWL